MHKVQNGEKSPRLMPTAEEQQRKLMPKAEERRDADRMFVPRLERNQPAVAAVLTRVQRLWQRAAAVATAAVAGAFSKTAACESKSAPKEAPTRAERTARNILEASVKRKDKEEVV